MAPRRSVVAWSLYDLANTIFSFNILSIYFPVWAKETLGASDSHLSAAFSGSMVLVALLSPPLGAWSDRVGRRLPFLIVSTVACVAATAMLGPTAVGGLGPVLLLYAAANLFFQLGLVFYDSLLPVVSNPDDVGKVGGAGVGIGYVGSFIGLALGAVLLATMTDPHPVLFAATAGVFLLFALPCFLFVKETTRPATGARIGAWAQFRRTLGAIKRRPQLARFLLSRLLYADAANTLILFMGIYATEEAGYTQQSVQPLLAAGILGGIVGGFLFGRIVDRAGPRRVLMRVLFIWMGTLATAALLGWFDLPREVFWIVALGSGLALGGTWAADRPLLLRLVPADRVGEFYGVYGMVGRFAAVLGPVTWAVVAEGIGWGRPAAVATLMLQVVIAAVILRPVANRAA